MSYLSDYILYNSGAETPEEYLHWGGLSILGHLLGNKVWITHGDHFRFFPNLYICLVGDAGSGKNTALSLNKELMIETFTSLMISSNIQSREDVAYQMASDDCIRVWKDAYGALQSYRPFYILNNELEAFLSVDQTKMIGFLVDVFDGKHFGTGFKGDRKAEPKKAQFFKNPHLSLLAGAVPTWFMGSLKMNLFSGGLGRRLIIVHAKRTKIIPDPRRPAGAATALARIKEHLQAAHEYQGEIRRSPDALAWWNEWYVNQKNSKPIDPILSQFHETEPMQLLKIALCLHMTERPFASVMPAEPLMAAAAMLEATKPSIMTLTSGIGRNELAGVGVQLLDFIARMGGMISETSLRRQFYRFMRTSEFKDIEENYIKSGELTIAMDPTTGMKLYFDKDGIGKYMAKKAAQQAAMMEALKKQQEAQKVL